MNKKGFTLVELLATILVLGIIAAIAVPTIGTISKNVKKGIAERSAEEIVKVASKYYSNIMAEQGSFTSTTLDLVESINDGILKVEGTIPTIGTVTIDENGVVNVIMQVENICVKASSTDKETTSEYIEDEGGIIKCE